MAILTSTDGKSKHYHWHQIAIHVFFAFAWCHSECCILWPWPIFSRPRHFKCEYLKSDESYRKKDLSLRLIFSIEWDQREWFWTKMSRSSFWSGCLISKARHSKHYYCHQIRTRAFVIEWSHCECVANYVLYEHFLCQEIWISPIRREQRTMIDNSFCRDWRSPSIGTNAHVIVCEIELTSKGHKFETSFSQKRWKLSQKCTVWLLQRLIFTIESCHCECRTTWPWPSFSRTNIFILCICNKNCTCNGFFRKIYLNSHGHRSVVDLVVTVFLMWKQYK